MLLLVRVLNSRYFTNHCRSATAIENGPKSGSLWRKSVIDFAESQRGSSRVPSSFGKCSTGTASSTRASDWNRGPFGQTMSKGTTRRRGQCASDKCATDKAMQCWCKFGTCPCAPRSVHFSLRVSPASLRFRWHRGCQPQGGKSTHAPQTVRCRFVRIRPPDVPQLDEYFQIPCRAKDRRGFSACRPGRRARLSMMAAQT